MGISFLLILIILFAAIGAAIFYGGIGAGLWHRKTDPARDKVEGTDPDAPRPEHLEVENEAQQRFVKSD